MMKTSVLVITACLVGVYNSCSATDVDEEIESGKPGGREFPYDVIIVARYVNKPKTGCLGSLISETWAMTSGRCCIDANSMTLFIGEDQTNRGNTQAFTIMNQDNIHPHPEYASGAPDNDICLIQLPSPATITEYVDIINLPPKSDAGPDTYEGKLVTPNGYGRIEDESIVTDRNLKFKKLKVMSNSECKETFGTNLTDNMFCTHKSTDGGLCQSLHGGQLMKQGTDGNTEVIGVLSDGSVCGTSNPFVYTQVAAYLDWINQVTGIPVQ